MHTQTQSAAEKKKVKKRGVVEELNTFFSLFLPTFSLFSLSSLLSLSLLSLSALNKK
jgi:hypothetical protein